MRFSWTQYSFTGGLSPVPLEQYHELCRLGPNEIEQIIAQIRRERWSQFRQDQSFLLCFVYAAPVCFFIGQTLPLFHLGTLWGAISGLSVGVSAFSFNGALDKRCVFFRKTYELAKASISYDAYAKTHLLMIYQGMKH